MKENKEIYCGAVCWFTAKLGYGFIKPDNGGDDIFVHFSDINCQGFKTLNKDQKVSYSIGTNKRGQPKAINVTVINS